MSCPNTEKPVKSSVQSSCSCIVENNILIDSMAQVLYKRLNVRNSFSLQRDFLLLQVDYGLKAIGHFLQKLRNIVPSDISNFVTPQLKLSYEFLILTVLEYFNKKKLSYRILTLSLQSIRKFSKSGRFCKCQCR